MVDLKNLRGEVDVTWFSVMGLPRGFVKSIHAAILNNNASGLLIVRNLISRAGSATVMVDANGNVVCGLLTVIALLSINDDVNINVDLRQVKDLDCNANPKACMEYMITQCQEFHAAIMTSTLPIQIEMKNGVATVTFKDLLIYMLKTYYKIDEIVDMLHIPRDEVLKSIMTFSNPLGLSKPKSKYVSKYVMIPKGDDSRTLVLAKYVLGDNVMRVAGLSKKEQERYARLVLRAYKEGRAPPPPPVKQSRGEEGIKVEVPPEK